MYEKFKFIRATFSDRKSNKRYIRVLKRRYNPMLWHFSILPVQIDENKCLVMCSDVFANFMQKNVLKDEELTDIKIKSFLRRLAFNPFESKVLREVYIEIPEYWYDYIVVYVNLYKNFSQSSD